MSKQDAKAFVLQIGQDRKLARKAAQVQEGDWEAMVRVGQDAGFDFTIAELQVEIPDSFYKDSPNALPHFSWDRSTLDT
ncbi:Nif11-like leader peptide family natural product precursor [Chloroflexi bacterium TSY]|nr:Nif11-like leader peptide family natural product precursor [Chloroflexi bacterium TSY]